MMSTPDTGIPKLRESAATIHTGDVAKNLGIMLRLSPKLIVALDRWRRDLPGVPNRQAAIRIAVEERLKAEGLISEEPDANNAERAEKPDAQ